MSFNSSGENEDDGSNEFDRLCRIGADPSQWEALDDTLLSRVVFFKCLEYGAAPYDKLVENLFRLYRYHTTRIDVAERMRLCNALAEHIKKQRGEYVLSLMPCMCAESGPEVRTAAAMYMCLLTPTTYDDVLAGPRAVVEQVLDDPGIDDSDGDILAGVLLLGDMRFVPLLEEAWPKLDTVAKLKLAEAGSRVATVGTISFYLRCLAIETDKTVFSALAAGLASMPERSEEPYVIDAGRPLPIWLGNLPPLTVYGTYGFREFLSQMNPQLESLAQGEEEPRVIPLIWSAWENADREV